MLLAQGRERTGEGLVEDSVGSGEVWDGLVGGGVMEGKGTWWCGRGGQWDGGVVGTKLMYSSQSAHHCQERNDRFRWPSSIPDLP